MTLNLSGTTNNLLLQLLILVYFLLLIKQCYYLLCEKRKNTSQSDLNGQNYPEGDELIKAKDIQFNEFPLHPQKNVDLSCSTKTVHDVSSYSL